MSSFTNTSEAAAVHLATAHELASTQIFFDPEYQHLDQFPKCEWKP